MLSITCCAINNMFLFLDLVLWRRQRWEINRRFSQPIQNHFRLYLNRCFYFHCVNAIDFFFDARCIDISSQEYIGCTTDDSKCIDAPANGSRSVDFLVGEPDEDPESPNINFRANRSAITWWVKAGFVPCITLPGWENVCVLWSSLRVVEAHQCSKPWTIQ